MSTAAHPTASPPPPSPRAEEAADLKSEPDDKPVLAELRDRVKEEVLRMTEFFDNELPGTLKKYNLVFSFSPRVGDLNRREFMRLPFRIRYGLREKWEIYAGMTPFMPNPFDEGLDHRWGPGEGRLGVRHDVGRLGTIYDHVTVGLEGRTPLGKPPVQIIDNYTHVTPFINTSRALPFPHTTLFTNYSYDRALDTPSRGPSPEGMHRRHTFAVTPGVLYKPGEFGFSFEYGFRYYEDDGLGCHLAHEFRAGPIWDVPLWRTQSWGLPGKWQIEFAYRMTYEEGLDKTDGTSVRVRWRTSVREIFSKKSYQRRPPPR
jgi:hypothetical protein